LRYEGIKVIELERHVLEHEGREKHSVINHGYANILSIIIGLRCFHVAVRVIRCVISRTACRRVASALIITSRVAANPESAGSGNIVNIKIKTCNESQSVTPEDISLRALKPSDSKTGEPETRSTRLLRPSRTYF
jgi:hypothetical protein